MLTELARDYITRYPQEAAGLMEALDPEQISSVLQSLSAATAAALLRCLTPGTAAAGLGSIPPPAAAPIIEALPIGVSSALLAQLPGGKLEAMLSAAAPATERAIRRLLRYPDGTIGAVMFAEPVALRAETLLTEALILARRDPGRLLPVLFVLDASQLPTGIVDVRDLLLASPDSELRSITRPCSTVLRAHERIEAALHNPHWAQSDYLPVVDADERFVGALRRSGALDKVLGESQTEGDGDAVAATVLALADLLWTPAAEFIAQASSRSLTEDDDNER